MSRWFTELSKPFTEIEKKVLTLRIGLHAKPMSFKQIAKIVGKTAAWACSVEKYAIEKIFHPAHVEDAFTERILKASILTFGLINRAYASNHYKKMDQLYYYCPEDSYILTPREMKVLEARNYETLEQVGRRFKVTRGRIRQIEQKALRKIRHLEKKKE